MTLNEIYPEIHRVFTEVFGRTPLRQRVEDIQGEANELSRFLDIGHLKEETGQLLASTLMLCHESGWNPAELIRDALNTIWDRQEQYKSMGRKTKVALLGGAFDPPTLGHIDVARFVLDTSKTFDEVWLVPCNQHMNNKRMASVAHRMEMARIAAKADARIRVSDYEIIHNFRGETYHFIKRLLEEDFAKKQYNFSMIIGMDNANTFPSWVNSADLERMIRFVVVPRAGVEANPDATWYKKSPHIILAGGGSIRNTSSTAARELLKHNEDSTPIMDVLDKEVYKYIRTNHLYEESK